MSACWLTSSPSITGRIGLPSTTTNANAARAFSKNDVVAPFANGPSDSSSESPAVITARFSASVRMHDLAQVEFLLQTLADPRPARHVEDPMDRWSPQIVIHQQCGLSRAGKAGCQLDGQRGFSLSRGCTGDHHDPHAFRIFSQEQSCGDGIDRMIQGSLPFAVTFAGAARAIRFLRQQRHGANHGQPESPREVGQRIDPLLAHVPRQDEKDDAEKTAYARRRRVLEAWFAVGRLGRFGR